MKKLILLSLFPALVCMENPRSPFRTSTVIKKIDPAITISKSGKYKLECGCSIGSTGGIIIDADNVDLNLHGNAISAQEGYERSYPLTAITIMPERTNIRVRNGALRELQRGCGILIHGSQEHPSIITLKQLFCSKLFHAVYAKGVSTTSLQFCVFSACKSLKFHDCINRRFLSLSSPGVEELETSDYTSNDFEPQPPVVQKYQ